MKIQNLSRGAVRSTARIARVAGLCDSDLKTVVAGLNARTIVDPEGPQQPQPVPTPVGPVDPATCAIHFYYPADAVS